MLNFLAWSVVAFFAFLTMCAAYDGLVQWRRRLTDHRLSAHRRD
jgi:hypothetical protein